MYNCTIYDADIPFCILLCVLVVHMDKDEKSKGPNLLYDAKG